MADIKAPLHLGFLSKVVLSVLVSAVCVPIATANPPTQPDNFRHEVYANRAAELFWDRSSDDISVIGYEIIQNGVSIGVFDALSHFTNTLIPGDTYTFTVAAVDNEDNRSAVSSVTFVAGENDPADEPDTTTPTTANPAVSAPTNVRSEVYSATSFEIFWDRFSGEYRQYEILLNGMSVEISDGTSHYFGNLPAGEDYSIDLIAIRSDGERSAPVNALVMLADGSSFSGGGETPEPITGTPPAPENASLAVYSSTAAELFWDRPSAGFGVVTTRVFRNGMLVDETTGTSYFDDTREAGVDYEYVLIAMNADGDADGSTTVGETNETDGGTDGETDGGTDGETDGGTDGESDGGTDGETDGGTDGETDGGTDGETDGGTDGETDGGTDGGTDGETDGGTDGGTDGETDGGTDGGTDGETDGGTDGETDGGTDGETDGGTDGETDGGTDGETDGNDNSVFVPDPTDIIDAVAFYDEDGYDTVNIIRVDIRTETAAGTCEIDDQSGCTLDDVIADVDGNDDFKVEIPIHFQSDDFADDGSTSNATLRQRGNTSRLGPQKSFRIKLDSKEDLWRNERRLQLNKHPFERTRQRNKLSFDLMQELPHLPSLRTQFVNLWVDDGAGPEDFGLFTHVEFAGKEYLQNRGTDKDDRVYKIEFFQFSQGDLNNVQVDENGEPVDEDRFEQSLSIERGDDHSTLVEMLTALNDPDQSFETVFERYFNHNNVLMWVTANLLMHQTDAITHNFYLYNPIDSEKFYFLPWDYDGTFQPEPVLTDSYETDAILKRLFYGYARGINSNFVSNYYRMPGIHQKILRAADEIRNTWLTDANITAKAMENDALVAPFLERSPDGDFNTHNGNIPLAFAGFVSGIHDQMRTAFDIPMPHSLEDVVVATDTVTFAWTPAHDVTESNTLDYDLEVATSTDFDADSIVLSVEDIPDAADLVEYEADISQLPSGQLYYRVTARGDSDPLRVWQVAENRLRTNGTTLYGMVEFEIP